MTSKDDKKKEWAQLYVPLNSKTTLFQRKKVDSPKIDCIYEQVTNNHYPGHISLPPISNMNKIDEF
jgi:hypothetical protein